MSPEANGCPGTPIFNIPGADIIFKMPPDLGACADGVVVETGACVVVAVEAFVVVETGACVVVEAGALVVAGAGDDADLVQLIVESSKTKVRITLTNILFLSNIVSPP